MVIGLGVDVVDVQRLSAALARTPKLAHRLFTDSERSLAPSSLAARFAAKEAVAKAVGGGHGIAWRDVEVVRCSNGQPSLHVTGTAAAAAAARGISSWHVSLSHDAGIATAIVIGEG